MNLLEYRDSIWKKLPILTTRFSNDTWNENQLFIKNKTKNQKMIYSAPIPISPKIISESFCVVLEMNNDTNQIMGIGLITNIAHHRKTNVYGDMNYNRYSYFTKKRIDCIDMSLKEKEMINILELLCFKGRGHLKRGQGITILPLPYLYELWLKKIDIIQFIRDMFNSRFIQ
jgi:hypothetical protein